MEKSEALAIPHEEINLLDLPRLLWAKKWIILAITVIFGVIGVATGFLWTKSYTAIATVFPISSKSSSSSQLAGLASLVGVSLGDGGDSRDPGRTVNALLSSRLLAETLASDPELASALDLPELRKLSATGRFRTLVPKLQKAVDSSTDKSSGVMSLSVTWTNPESAQLICNRLVTVLDNLLVGKSLTGNKKRALTLQKQIEIQKAKVEELQNRVADFQRTTSLIDPRAQSTQTIQTYASLIRDRMNLELKLATAKASYSAGNPRIRDLQTQLDNLEVLIGQVKSQVDGDLPSMKSAPDDLIRFQNLTMDLDIATKIYSGLLAGMEQASLVNDDDQVYIEVLDQALLPYEPSPSFTTIVIFFVAGGVFLSVIWVLGLVFFSKPKSGPDEKVYL